MKYLHIDSQLFINNRREFSKKLKENTLAIFNSNDIMPTNADGTIPFRQNNDLFWLSGVDQEESVLVVFPNNNEKEILFLKETSELIAIWEGAKLTKEEALNTSGISAVYWLSEIEEKLEIEDLGTFEIGVGELFEKTIVSNKEDVSYTDDSELFEISANGKISFTANKMDKGTHFVIITAETTAEKDNEFVIFKVTG